MSNMGGGPSPNEAQFDMTERCHKNCLTFKSNVGEDENNLSSSESKCIENCVFKYLSVQQGLAQFGQQQQAAFTTNPNAKK
eukprot:gene7680-12146_t